MNSAPDSAAGLLAALGQALGSLDPGRATPAVLLAAAAMLLSGSRSALPAGRVAGLLVLALVALRVAGALEALPGARLPTRLTGKDLELSGSICDFPHVEPGLARFVFVLDPGPDAVLPQRLMVSAYDGAALPAIGERWRLTLRVRPPRSPVNPGGWDAERWSAAAGIGGAAYVRAWPPPVRLGPASGCPFAGWRGRIAAAVARAVGEGPALPYLLGLTVGAYAALPAAEWDVLRATGTVHLISISGFHIALVAVPFLLLGRWVARGALWAQWSCAPAVAGAVVAGLSALVYGGLAGYSVPTVRSLVMLLIAAAWLWTRQPLGAGGVLGLSVAAVLLIEPLGLLTPGFWLSFGGVVLLVAGGAFGTRGAGLGAGPRPPGLRWSGAVLSFLRVQAVVSLGLLPLQLAWFGQVPLAGALANLLAIPVFSVALLPLALAGAATVLPVPALGGFLLRVAAAVVDAWRDANAVFAALPAATLSLDATPLALAAAVAGTVVLLVPRPWPCRLLGLLFFVPLAVVVAGPAGGGPAGALVVRVLDVGQGTAVLVQTPGQQLLYDTGPGSPSPAGSGRLLPVLSAAGASRLDVLVVSHGDRDHAGEAAALLAARPGARFWSSGFGVPGREATACRAGRGWRRGGYRFTFLHPVAGAEGRRPGNDDSCVLLVEGPGGRVLLTGDIGRRVERRLAEAGSVPRVDLALVAHHGSSTSSDDALIAAARPRYAVVSAGFGNRWGFPRPAVREAWQRAGSCLLDTATGGQLVFAGDARTPLRLVRRVRTASPWPWRASPRGAPDPCGA